MSARTISAWSASFVLVVACGVGPSVPPVVPTVTVGPIATAVPTPVVTVFPARTIDAVVITFTGENPGGYDLSATVDAIWVGGNDGLFKIDPATNKVTFEVTTTSTPRRFAIAGDAAWIGDFDRSLVRRVDLATGTETMTIATGVNPEVVVAAFGSIWTADHRGGTVTRIDPVTHQVIATIEKVGNRGSSGPQGMTASPDRIWVGVPNADAIFAIDPATNTVVRSIPGSGVPPCGPILVDAMIWVSACFSSPHVSRIDPDAATAARLELPGYAGQPVRIGDRIWIPAIGIAAPVLVALSPTDGTILDIVSLPTAGDSALVAFNSLWLADPDSGTVIRIPLSELGG